MASKFTLKPYEEESDFQVCLTQNSVLQITLSGPALVGTILAIICAVNFLQPSLTCTLIALAPIPSIIYNDYENFILLGPGGTPATFFGYLTITYLRLFAISDPYTPAINSEQNFPRVGYHQIARYLLPKRIGPRPSVRGIAPQRQIDQPGCKEMYLALRTSLVNLATRRPDDFKVGQSCFEKQGIALFARRPINATCRGEIVHIHHSDKSMHMNLHPDDARVVLEKGWGERHPLARGGWMRQYVPQEFVMIYAPRDRAELDAVCKIIEAASYWVSGKPSAILVASERIYEQAAETEAK